MNLTYDPEANAAYITLSKAKISKTQELRDALIIDKDDKGNLVGIEILNASHQQNLITSLMNSLPKEIGGVLAAA